MNKKIHSLALLVNLGIYGVAMPALADDNTADAQHEDTMVITAAEQNLQAPGYRPSPPMKSVKTRPHVTWPKSFAPCLALT